MEIKEKNLDIKEFSNNKGSILKSLMIDGFVIDSWIFISSYIKDDFAIFGLKNKKTNKKNILFLNFANNEWRLLCKSNQECDIMTRNGNSFSFLLSEHESHELYYLLWKPIGLSEIMMIDSHEFKRNIISKFKK